MTDPLPFLPYPRIGHHGVIGDRRTAALVAADGTLAWLCLPHYDGSPLFGALLDAGRGGFWRVGPPEPSLGEQRYPGEGPVLTTRWAAPHGELELTDAMAWPWDDRDAAHGGEDGRVLLRRVRCTRGAAAAVSEVQPRVDFGEPPRITATQDGMTIEVTGRTASLWGSRPGAVRPDGSTTVVELTRGDEIWFVLAWGEEERRPWTASRAAVALEETIAYWREWTATLDYAGPRGDRLRRSAATIHLLSYAPTGSPVAAPTTSLPERIGGERNWDYRYSWVRDSALSVTMLSRLGVPAVSRRYLDCLASYRSSTDSPLQIVYGIDGALDLPEQTREDVAGYLGSRPVRIGNRACGQRQLDSLGFFADAALTYLEHDGEWTDEHWTMVRRAADYTAAAWQQPERGVWELSDDRHYVSGKVMAWVALDRAVAIAERTGRRGETDGWRATMALIHAEVMDHGWSERRRAFRAHYATDDLDASALLIPILGFLPIDHPRVVATIERIVAELTVDRFVYRFRADGTDGPGELPLGGFEGAFLPCTFWLATVRAMAGRREEAEAILAAAEAVAGELGLFAEEVDVADRSFLGNTPLLFAHAEYLRAVMTLAAGSSARSPDLG